MKYVLQSLSILCAFCVVPASSHHSPFVKFDFREVLTIRGVIAAFELKNPHSIIYLDVSNEAGEVEPWEVEMAGKLSLSRRGWTDDTIALGDTVTVTGNPAMTGRSEIWWNTLTLEDGTTFVDPTIEDNNAIDEQRRQRAAERTR